MAELEMSLGEKIAAGLILSPLFAKVGWDMIPDVTESLSRSSYLEAGLKALPISLLWGLSAVGIMEMVNGLRGSQRIKVSKTEGTLADRTARFFNTKLSEVFDDIANETRPSRSLLTTIVLSPKLIAYGALYGIADGIHQDQITKAGKVQS